VRLEVVFSSSGVFVGNGDLLDAMVTAINFDAIGEAALRSCRLETVLHYEPVRLVSRVGISERYCVEMVWSA
jgi:hypothetical protein